MEGDEPVFDEKRLVECIVRSVSARTVGDALSITADDLWAHVRGCTKPEDDVMMGAC